MAVLQYKGEPINRVRKIQVNVFGVFKESVQNTSDWHSVKEGLERSPRKTNEHGEVDFSGYSKTSCKKSRRSNHPASNAACNYSQVNEREPQNISFVRVCIDPVLQKPRLQVVGTRP